ncbi:hypothetical protein GCM10007063_31510 [Lentibacillus kapialis]|uniref:Uncharacterized protein n=1 Tax=Lentibacillus kapialis TaxID=340214 RepID=A0A917Q1W0_9BACI|nr:hypothetical protein GCM10007063_31510 [Lentibacillus kapialis]
MQKSFMLEDSVCKIRKTPVSDNPSFNGIMKETESCFRLRAQQYTARVLYFQVPI